jgi:NDP-sugar pyrophosphorylase family protein
VASYLRPDEPFCFTYGDGVGDVDIRALIDFHKSHGLEPTVTVVRPPGRFGAIVLTDHLVTRFAEKPLGDDGYINGGFFVVHPKALQRIAGDHMPWELAPLDGLPADRSSPPTGTTASGSRWTRCAQESARGIVEIREGSLEDLAMNDARTPVCRFCGAALSTR